MRQPTRRPAAGKILDQERAVLLLVLDLLEALFTDHRLTTDERRRFVAVIGALARCKRMRVVASMRADLWHRAAETPSLIGLAERLAGSAFCRLGRPRSVR
jgi:hypothetical protein